MNPKLIKYAIYCFSSYIIFLWSQGIVTRRPLVLQLHQTDEGRAEYGEFLHAPKKKFTDFGMSTFNARCIFSLAINVRVNSLS